MIPGTRRLLSSRVQNRPISYATNPVGMEICTKTIIEGFSDRPAVPVLSDYAYQEALSLVLAFHRLGRLHDRTVQAQQHRASGLALVTAAIALWNTVYLGRALGAARRRGNLIPDALLAHLAPVGWQHLNLTGDYLWGADTSLGPDGFRLLRGTVASQNTAVAA